MEAWIEATVSVRFHLQDGHGLDQPVPPLVATVSPVVDGRADLKSHAP
jgi:hypothetical protein